jgi:hypothetical protein
MATRATWLGHTYNASVTFSGGDLIATRTDSSGGVCCINSTIAVTSGKWYWEITADEIGITANAFHIGIATESNLYNFPLHLQYLYRSDGNKYKDGIAYAYGDSYTDGDVIGIAVDFDAKKIWFSKNGVWQASGDPGAGTNEAFASLSGEAVNAFVYLGTYQNNKVTANFGQTVFTYAVPSGFKSGLYTGGIVVRGDSVEANDAQIECSANSYAYGADYIGYTGTYQYDALLRFPSVDIDQAASISDAHIILSESADETGSLLFNIYGVNADNQGTISSYLQYAALPLTSAHIAWTPTWLYDGSGSPYKKIDITAIIQEIVNRTGWVSGNAITIIIKHQTSSVNFARITGAYDNYTSERSGAALYVEIVNETKIPAFQAQGYGNYCVNATIPMFQATLYASDGKIHIKAENVSLPAFTASATLTVSDIAPQPEAILRGSLPAIVGHLYGGGIAEYNINTFGFTSTGFSSIYGSMSLPLAISLSLLGSTAISGSLLMDLSKFSLSSSGLTAILGNFNKGFVFTFTPTGIVCITGQMALNINKFSTSTVAGIESHADGTFTITFGFGAEGSIATYRSMVLNLKNNGLTEFLNYSFNSLVAFDGKFFGVNSGGIYELTGTQDVASNISWSIKTPRFDLETDNMKKLLRHAWLGYKPSGDIMLTAIMPDGEEYEYLAEAINAVDNGIRIKFGKGIKTRYVEFELANIANESLVLDKFRIFAEPVSKVR